MAKYFLARVDFTPDQENVRDFNKDKAAQHAYISLNKSAQTTHQGFIEDKTLVTLPYTWSQIQDYNYMAFDNEQGIGWEYAFITPREIKSKTNCEVEITMDFWQNEHMNIVYGQCMVEREHMQRHRKTAGGYVLPMPYAVSDMMCGPLYATHKARVPQILIPGTKDPMMFMIIAYQISGETGDESGNFIAESSYSPVEYTNYCAVPFNPKNVSQVIIPGVSTLADYLESDLFKNPNVRTIYSTPYLPADIIDPSNYTTYGVYRYGSNPNKVTLTATRPLYYSGESPMYTFVKDIELPPFMSYLKESDIDYTGASNIYSETKLLSSPYLKAVFRFENSTIDMGWEDLAIYNTNGKSYIRLNVEISLTLDGANITYGPDTFDVAQREFFSQSVKLTKFTPLESDKYLDYIFSNRATFNTGLRNNLVETAAQTTLAIGAGLAGGGGDALAFAGQAAISSASRIAQEMNMRADLKGSPKQMRSTANDFLDAFSNLNPPYITFYILTPRIEEQRSIFDFYNKFGYKVNRNKIPFTNNRRWFNYVKMTDINIKGINDHDDLQNFKSIFNRGVTIWHTYYDGTNLQYVESGDYKNENGEVVRSITNPALDDNDINHNDGNTAPTPVGPPTPLPPERFTGNVISGSGAGFNNCVIFVDMDGSAIKNYRNKSDFFIRYFSEPLGTGNFNITYNLLMSGKLLSITSQYSAKTYVFEHYNGLKTHINSPNGITIAGVQLGLSNIGTTYNTFQIPSVNNGIMFEFAVEWFGTFINPRSLDTGNYIKALSNSTPGEWTGASNQYIDSYYPDAQNNNPGLTYPLSFMYNEPILSDISPFDLSNSTFTSPVGTSIFLKNSFFDSIPVGQRSTCQIEINFVTSPGGANHIKIRNQFVSGDWIGYTFYSDFTTGFGVKPIIPSADFTIKKTLTYASRTGADILLGTFKDDNINVLYSYSPVTDSYGGSSPSIGYSNPLNYMPNRKSPLWKKSAPPEWEDPMGIINETGFMTPFKNKKYPVTNDYGTGSFPSGMQWNLPGQTEIFASQAGVVVDVYKWYDLTPALLPSYGAYVIIETGPINGITYKHIYSHLENIQVYVGQVVNKGDLIAKMAPYSNEHLGIDHPSQFYFEIKANNVSVDPKLYIKEW